MALEARRLIGISLMKIAQSRANRGGVSLHKNLLVATVLQKARNIFMEEASYASGYAYPPMHHIVQPVVTIEPVPPSPGPSVSSDVGIASGNSEGQLHPEQCPRCPSTSSSSSDEEDFDKENQPPTSELTYYDLDSSSQTNNILRVVAPPESPSSNLKRRRAVVDGNAEAEESPKKRRNSEENEDDSVFYEDNESVRQDGTMEIDRITSLVSIFSFGSLSGNSPQSSEGVDSGLGKLTRSVSTPDLCSAQAKEPADTLQQRQYLAMTV